MRHSESTRRREGDAIPISGDYQYRAITVGHPIQRVWHANKLRLIDAVLPPVRGSRVIDIGCGSGVIANHLAQNGATVIGTDLNRAATDFASNFFKQPNLEFRYGRFPDVVSESSFDAVYCLEVLEHLYWEQAGEMLVAAWKKVRPGGCLFITTPNCKSLWPAIEWVMDRSGRAPRLDEEQHVTRFDITSLRTLLQDAGWNPLESGSFNGLGPFLAPLSRKLAEWVCAREIRYRRTPLFNLLYTVAQRPIVVPTNDEPNMDSGD